MLDNEVKKIFKKNKKDIIKKISDRMFYHKNLLSVYEALLDDFQRPYCAKKEINWHDFIINFLHYLDVRPAVFFEAKGWKRGKILYIKIALCAYMKLRNIPVYQIAEDLNVKKTWVYQHEKMHTTKIENDKDYKEIYQNLIMYIAENKLDENL